MHGLSSRKFKQRQATMSKSSPFLNAVGFSCHASLNFLPTTISMHFAHTLSVLELELTRRQNWLRHQQRSRALWLTSEGLRFKTGCQQLRVYSFRVYGLEFRGASREVAEAPKRFVRAGLRRFWCARDPTCGFPLTKMRFYAAAEGL